MRRILHIDMDAFYASVEQRDDPSLCGEAEASPPDHLPFPADSSDDTDRP